MVDRRTLQFHEIVGKGGFGTVYRATYGAGGGFQKDVAVKILKSGWSSHEIAAPRLRDEARLLGLLNHRAIPSVDGMFWLEGHCALVVEYVHGASLLQVARTHPLPVGVAIEVCAEVAAGLHAAYSRVGPDGQPLNLVHRDIKPANIQLTPHGEVKVLDFGIARADFSEREAETSRILLGSITYMAPERLDMITGPEGDVYALGIALAESVASKKFGKTSANPERHTEHIDLSLAALRQVVDDPDVDVLLALVRDMLQYQPSKRPTAKELERRCRELRRQVRGPWLADWAEHHVTSAAAARELLVEDDGTGRWLGRTVVMRDTAAPAVEPDPPRPVRSSAGRGFGGALLVGVPLLLVGLLGLLLVGGVVVWRVSSSRAPQVALDDEDVQGAASVPTQEIVEAIDIEPSDVSAPPESAPPMPPAPPAPPTAAPAPAPADRTQPSAKGGTAAGSPVTTADFAAFVASHPEWSKQAAAEAGHADSNYLRDWVNGTPPSGQRWAVSVSWDAAAAFCGARGGLAKLADGPATWPESGQPFQEWRQEEGRAAWRRYDGATSVAVRRADANAFTGFRCTR